MKQDMDKLVEYKLVEEFWLKKLQNIGSNPIFGDKKFQDAPQENNINHSCMNFPDQLSEKVHTVTGGAAAKTFLVFLTALNILSYKYTGHPEILVSTTGIREEENPGETGDGLLFFQARPDKDSNPRILLNSALKELNEVYKYRHYEFESLLQRCQGQNLEDREALYNLGLQYTGFNRESRWLDSIQLVFKIEGRDRDFALAVKYNTAYYRQEQAEQLGRHFINILAAMLENLDKPVKEIDIYTGEEREKMLREFSGEVVEYTPVEKTFIPYFQHQVLKTPHDPAVSCEQRLVTYRELDEGSGRLSRWMQKEAALGPEDLVALVMERSEKMVQIIIAAWKLGAAYVPVDPDFPAERVKTIAADSRVKLLIHEPGHLSPALSSELKALTHVAALDRIEAALEHQDPGEKSKHTPDAVTRPGTLAYVIYTSGTTGKPKGAMVEHRGMMNHLFAKVAEIEIAATSVIAQNASQCFDISVWQFFTALLQGGRTEVFTDRWVLNPGEFIEQVDRCGITILEVVPSYLAMMMEIMSERNLTNLFQHLSYLLVTGEAVRPSLVERWFHRYPAVRMVNAYGPTEASDDITHFKMERNPGLESIPIGRVVRNFRIYIVADHLPMCPIGVKGEICVTGIGVGRGYLNHPQLTAEKFVRQGDERLYQTGDMGRWLKDGNIEFLGRKDYQVKVRGYRIEMEEIENKLSTLAGIKEAVVLDKEDNANNKYLCAYITLRPGIEKKSDEIKRELRAMLPEYMVPAHIVVLETLPLTPNGKVDRKALPEAGAVDISGVKYLRPRNNTEKKLVEIWQEVLGIEKIGIRDSFFNLGGDSFKGIWVVNKIQDWLQEVVHVTILFLAPTIEELAVKLESYKVVKHARVDDAAIEQMRRIIPPLPPLPEHLKAKEKNPPAIFILCPPRSGSTLLRVILTGHPRLFAPQEFELMTFNTMQERKEGLSGKFSFYLEGVVRAVMEIKGVDADEAKALITEYEDRDLTIQAFYRVLQEWLGEKILIEKTPAYTLDLEILNRVEEYFENPLYLHLVRNPYAVVHSFENAKLDQLFKYDHDFPPRELAELVWLISHQNILAFLEGIPANRRYRVNYEEMVSDPERVVSGICRFLGVEYYQEMIRVYDNPQQRMTDGIYTESKMLGDVRFFTHSSINTGSVEKWKEKYKTRFLGETALGMAQRFGYLKEESKSGYTRLEPAEKAEYYPLSSAHKRLYFLQQMDMNSTSYNKPLVIPLGKNIHISQLESAMQKMIRRHESFRTSFITVKETPVQRIQTPGEIHFSMDYFEVAESEIGEIIKNFIRPFDMTRAPLARAGVIVLPGNRYVWLVDIHHIISDGTSQTIITEDFLAIYRGQDLPAKPLQYKDFSQWQNRLITEGKIKSQEEYWHSLYADAGDIPRLNLVEDFKRPAVFTFAGARYNFMLAGEEVWQLRELEKRLGVTLYMNILALLNTLFFKYTGQTDIIIGSGIAGRLHLDLQHIVGMFVNTLAMRNHPQGEKTYEAFLKEVAATSIKAFENQHVQFEELVDQLNLERDPSRNPLFDISVVVQNFRKVGEGIPQRDKPLQVEEVPFIDENSDLPEIRSDNPTSKFDMTFFVIEGDNREIFISIEYYTAIFKEETIQRLATHFKTILQAAAANPAIQLKDIDLLSLEEKEKVLQIFNESHQEYPLDKTVYDWYTLQTGKKPHRVALVSGEEMVSYGELQNSSVRIAQYLSIKGVNPGSEARIGIILEKGLITYPAVLGILKTGGVYVPIEPSLPMARKKHIIIDAGIGIVLSGKKHIGALNRLQWECPCFHSYLCMDTHDVYNEEEEEKNELMNLELWEHVGKSAADEIAGGGWVSSYTGELISAKEMEEYGENVAVKLEPLLHPGLKVLEIGCATGLTMYRLAPRVKLYYGTDLSEVIIEKNQQKIRAEGLQNIRLANLAAHEIHRLVPEEGNFDLVIINSVIQCFHGHNYLRRVIRQAVSLMAEKGTLFIGDIMDQEKKQALEVDMMNFKRQNPGKGYTTKTEFSAELFVSRGYWQDLAVEMEEIGDISCSDKIYTIENELTRYRYDVCISIDKNPPQRKKRGKIKNQDDLRNLETFASEISPSGKNAAVLPHELAYVIYTSGSTGKPKGVMIAHRSLVNLCYWHNRYYEVTETDHAAQYAQMSFDASVWEIFPYLIMGAALYTIPPGIRLDIKEVNHFFEIHDITIAFLPTQFCEQYMEVENKSLRILLTGGDRMQSFIKRDYELYNNYGPTENTVVSTSYLVTTSLPNIPIGRPVDNTQVYILGNDGLFPQPVGIPGELYIGGDNVARGYVNNPELTNERFLLISNTDYRSNRYMTYLSCRADKKLYKTGDRGRWQPDGNIEFLGRLDTQVKIRGYRIELEEIENRLLDHEDTREVVVIQQGAGNEALENDKYLCAYIVLRDNCKSKTVAELDLRDYLASLLPEYMIPNRFIQLERIPLTISGKVDRSVLAVPDDVLTEDYTPPRDILESRLVEIWSEVLNIDKEKISITANFFELGGHSLKATVLTSKIHKELKVKLPLVEVFQRSTVKGMAEYIRGAARAEYTSIVPLEKKECYPLSSAQKRLYFLQQMDLNSTGYNIPLVVPLGKDIDISQLESTLQKMIRRHESFRTSFVPVQEIPVQRIQTPGDIHFSLDYFEVAESDAGEIIKNFIKPFNLNRAPLARTGVIAIPGNRYIWMVDIHHIISDGTSQTIIIEDFLAMYRGQYLPAKPLQYKDFSQWQNRLIAEGKIKRQEEYWHSLYTDAGDIPRLNLPEDFKRPPVFTFAGTRYSFVLAGEGVSRFRELGTKSGVTLYMNILALLNTLFFKYTGQTDIIIGSGIAGRPHMDLQRIVGMFVNTLAMRNQPQGEKTYDAFLKEVAANCIDAFENQELQFEELVDQLNVERDPTRNPLFDISMVVQNFRKVGEGIPQRDKPLQVEEVPFIDENNDHPGVGHKNLSSKFDMTFFVREVGNREILISIEYYTAIFKEETIQRLSGHIKRLIRQVARNPQVRLEQLEIIAEEEKKEVLESFNNTRTPYPADKTIGELFTRQVEETPHHIAVVMKEEALTYEALAGQTRQVAGYLNHENRQEEEQLVGVFMERSLAMITAIIGILQAGGAYVPLSPQYPAERVKTITRESGIQIIIGDKRQIKALNRLQWECLELRTILCIDSEDVHQEPEEEANELMSRKLWEYVGETAVDEITGGGWKSSYTGEAIPKAEMDEYGDNIVKKLEPLLHPEMRILEIGAASGISMYRLAPRVGLYYGTDLSQVIIDKNRERIKQEGHTNIKVARLAAHEIDRLEEKEFDLVILNSVIQCFNGHNYLRQVIRKALALMKPQGYLFIGDIMDQEMKEALVRDLVRYKEEHRGSGYKTKTDWSQELFISRSFLEDLRWEIPAIKRMEFSGKIYTLENELTRYRYDALLYVDNAGKGQGEEEVAVEVKGEGKGIRQKSCPGRHKNQYDRRDLQKYGAGQAGQGGREIGIRQPRQEQAGHLAYIMYTSGSTGIPKGVMVQHRNVVRLVKNNYFVAFAERERILQTGVLEFDASTFEIWGALLNGFELHLVEKNTMLSPAALGDVIRRSRITTLWMTAALYNRMVEEEIEIFAPLRNVLVGGDVLSPPHVNRLLRKYPWIRMINGYGPTENTTFSTTFGIHREYESNIPIGRPIANSTAYIVDSGYHLQPVGIPGELVVGGDGVTRGYLNRVEMTAEKFILLERFHKHYWSDRSYITSLSYSPGKYYKTGDMARWLPGGIIEFRGREDQQVKIRGYRIELEEIRDCLLKQGMVREAVVIDWEEVPGEKQLCAYMAAGQAGGEATATPPETLELREYLSRRLPDYMIPSYFHWLEAIPLTANGKVDRDALPEPGMMQRKDNQPPQSETEKKLAGIWQDVLGRKTGTGAQETALWFGIDDNFFELGGHSLKAIAITSRIHKEFNVKVPLAEIFKTPTVRELAAYIERTRKEQYIPIEPVESKEYYPLSHAQKRLWILAQMEKDQIAYNIPGYIELGDLNREAFAMALGALIKRHEILRTAFITVAGEPRQMIHPYESLPIEGYYLENLDIRGEENKDHIANNLRERERMFSFNLETGPLLRMVLIHIEEQRYMFLYTMHHIISDAWSAEVVKKEFVALFQSYCRGKENPLSPLRIQYKDYTQWHTNQLSGENLIKHRSYWWDRFKGEIPVLELPTDYPRPKLRSFEGEILRYTLTKEMTDQLKRMSKENDCRLFIIALALVTVFLYRYTGQEDIILGLPVAGREHQDLESQIGFYVNMLAIRNKLTKEQSFTGVIQRVKQVTMEALEHQIYPFEQLVAELNLKRDVNRNPLFDVVVALLTGNDRGEDSGDTLESEAATSKHDMRFRFIDHGAQIGVDIQYNVRLFKKERIMAIRELLMDIITGVITKADEPIDRISFMTGTEKQQSGKIIQERF